MSEIITDFKIYPTVFAVGSDYQIFIPLEFEAIISIRVGEKIYYDDSNGILRSNNRMHHVDIPMCELDKACNYTVICRKMIERKPYFPTSEEPFEVSFDFKPVMGENINIYHIADAHNMEDEPIAAGQYFGDELDLLILNGDIPNHSGEIANFNSIYRIAYGITKGRIPVVFSRGNHDTRGIFAEEFVCYTPNDNGKTYYTFKLGSLWGLVLDCGEDKLDSHEEYGNTVCFHNFRLKETEYIKNVINNAENEYNHYSVEHKIIICHIPFMRKNVEPFNIEQELYKEWTKIICENIKPEIIFFGHTHKCAVYEPSGEYDNYGYQNCIAVVGSEPDFTNKTFKGCGVVLGKNEPHVTFNSNK